MSKFYFFTILMLTTSFLFASPDSMHVNNATMKKVGDNVYEVTVSGDAPTPGYKISAKFSRTSRTAIDVKIQGSAPGGGDMGGGMMVIQVITPYEETITVKTDDDVEKIRIIGSNQVIDLKVAAPKPAPEMASHVQRIALKSIPNRGEGRVAMGDLFLAEISLEDGAMMDTIVNRSPHFSCVGFYSYRVGERMHFGYVCKVKPEVSVRSFMVIAKGTNAAGEKITCEAQIMVSGGSTERSSETRSR